MSLYIDIEKNFGNFHLKTKLATSMGTTGLLGASGCGKSMTLKCIAGIEKPDKGKIILNDVILFDSENNINLKPQQRKIGYLFQNYALFPNMTVLKNIMCGLHREKNPSLKTKKAAQMIELLQLQGIQNLYPHQLSGGQAQRVALGRILVNDVNLLMLDEPFSALDSHLRGQLQLHMKELLKNFGKDVLLVTHSRDEAYTLCDKIGVMDNGALVVAKDTKDLFANPENTVAARLTGCKNIVPAKKISTHVAEIPSWGITLETALPLKDNLSAVAIRAHHFATETQKNSYPITILDYMEKPFEVDITFKYKTQISDTPLWWRVPKKGETPTNTDFIGISPDYVLPLYD